jgi:hypothetical protein
MIGELCGWRDVMKRISVVTLATLMALAFGSSAFAQAATP